MSISCAHQFELRSDSDESLALSRALGNVLHFCTSPQKMNRNTLEDHLPQVFKYVRGWLTVKPNLDHNLSQIDGQIKIHVEPYYLFTIF